MTSKFILAALTAGLLLGASAGAMAADAPKAPKLTAGVAKALTEAQTANGKKDFPTAMAAVEKAKAVSGATPYDQLTINRFAMSIHVGMGDLAAAEVDAEAAADLDPSVIPDADKATVYKPALQLALNAKKYDKAAKYAKLYQTTNPPAADMALISQALYLGGDAAGAAALAQKNVDAAVAAGQKPQRNDLEVLMASQVKQNNQPAAEKTLEVLVASYNMPEDWSQLREVSLTAKGMRDIDYIYLGRLMRLQGGKIRPEDATLVGSAGNSNKLGLYGDAEAMQKFGGPAPDPRAVADKKSLPKQIADGAKNDGEYNIKTAEAAYGYGQYADAEALARAAKTKPGVKDPTEPDMVIAMSLAAQGKNAEAATIFDSIKQSNPASARVVRLWGYHTKAQANPGATAPAATAAAAPAAK
jgi:hypothetical protein